MDKQPTSVNNQEIHSYNNKIGYGYIPLKPSRKGHATIEAQRRENERYEAFKYYSTPIIPPLTPIISYGPNGPVPVWPTVPNDESDSK